MRPNVEADQDARGKAEKRKVSAWYILLCVICSRGYFEHISPCLANFSLLFCRHGSPPPSWRTKAKCAKTQQSLWPESRPAEDEQPSLSLSALAPDLLLRPRPRSRSAALTQPTSTCHKHFHLNARVALPLRRPSLISLNLPAASGRLFSSNGAWSASVVREPCTYERRAIRFARAHARAARHDKVDSLNKADGRD